MKKMESAIIRVLILSVVSIAMASMAQAQPYPVKPI